MPMSVMLFDPEQFAAIYAQYAGMIVSLPVYAPEIDVFADALYAGYLANRAAYAATYPHDVQALGETENLYPLFERTPITMAVPPDLARKWIAAVRSLEYNTISNGGACYWPEQRRDIVFYAERLVLDKLAGLTD